MHSMTDQTISISPEPRGGPTRGELGGRPSPGAALASQIADAKAKRDRSKSVRPLRDLAPSIWAHRGLAAGALAALIGSTAMTLGLTGGVRLVMDHGFGQASSSGGGSTATLDRYFLILVAVAALLALFTASRVYFVNRLGERVVADLRKQVYAHVLKLDQAYFLQIRTGEVLSRMTADMAIVESMAGANASVALRNLLMVIGGLTVLFFVSPKLTFCVLLIIPATVLPLLVFGRRVRRLSVQAQDRFADAVGFAGETLDQLDTVQAFGRERSAGERFGGAVDHAFTAAVDRIQARALLTAFVMLFMFCGVAFVLWLGAESVRAGTMTGGALAQFVFVAVLAAGSVGALGEVWGEVQKAAGAMERINELLAARPAIAAPAHPIALPVPPRGEIVFDDVTFHYPGRPDLPALNGFSLTVRPGETVALVGPSGGGKSTVLRLLLRFYDPQGGAIRIDGVDLRDADPSEVRARLALVAQDAALFSGSAFDNIAFGREGASEADSRAAAQAAQAEGFLKALPEGFSGNLGERGKSLSGGQRQRMAIARALVRNAPILLLDEATSALDAENEHLVQRALDEAMTGRTTLVVAHRLATVLRADRIVVMENGRVSEQGRHVDLAGGGGLYARLAKLQFQTQDL
jgi:ATP-binding cassette subfamily B protein